jgi:hypothetical protein
MKIRIMSLLILSLFTTELFISCEDSVSSGEWIFVKVRVYGKLIKKNKNTGEELCDSYTKGVSGQIVISANRNEYIDARTDTSCYFFNYGDYEEFKLYQDKQITIKIIAWNVPAGFTQIPGIDSLTYNEAISHGSNWYYEYNSSPTVIWLYE